jgi:predicted aspartyl protease
MSLFRVNVGVSNLHNHEYVYADAIVDTGATHSMFPADFLNDVQVEPFDWGWPARIADGSTVELSIGAASLHLMDRESPCNVLFGSPGIFLIGATTLENFGLAVDPVNERLIPLVENGLHF